MDDIRRIGPATPISRRGSDIDLSVPLNATPTRTWWRTFQSPDDWQEPCHQSWIKMKYGALIFTCEEWRIPLWMTAIDKWITLANERHGEYAQSRVGVAGCGV